MADVDLNQVHPVFKFRLEQILEALTAIGWQPRVASLRRSSAEQAKR